MQTDTVYCKEASGLRRANKDLCQGKDGKSGLPSVTSAGSRHPGGDVQPVLHWSASVPAPCHRGTGFQVYWAGAEKNTENSWSRSRQTVLDVLGNTKEFRGSLTFHFPPWRPLALWFVPKLFFLICQNLGLDVHTHSHFYGEFQLMLLHFQGMKK